MTAARARLAGLVAAALAAAAGLVGLSPASAGAAYCSGTGVNVVVDFGGLGGGVQKACDASGAGKSARQVFPAAGFSLTNVRQSAFVCRVGAKPGPEACNSTPPANAYWGLFWSDGKSGKWNYSTTGVDGLDVPSGGFLAFAWQGSSSRRNPAASPVSSTPTPTKAPTRTPTKAPTKAPTKQPKPTRTPAVSQPQTTAETKPPQADVSAKASVAPTPTGSRPASPSTSPTASPTPSSAVAPTDADTPTTDPQAGTGELDGTLASSEESNDDGLPAWVPVAVIVVLAGAAGGILWWRRRPVAP